MKNNITKRMILSYIGLSMSLLLVVGIVFLLTVNYLTLKNAKTDLFSDATNLKNILIAFNSKSYITSQTIDKPTFKQQLKNKFGSYDIVSRLAITDVALKLLYPSKSQNNLFYNNILLALKSKINKSEIENQTFSISVNGKKYMIAVLPPHSKSSTDFEYYIFLYVEIDSVERQVRTMIFVLLVSLFAASLLAVVFGTIFGKTFAKPILIFQEGAERLAKRDLKSPIFLPSNDEFESLANTFNDMALEIMARENSQKEFFQNVSHELKTPLTSIQGYAEGIKDGVFADNDKALDIISDEAIRLKGLVDELLLISKLDTYNDIFKFTNTDVNQILVETGEKLAGIANTLGKKITLNMDKNAIIFADHEKLQQAFINILGNSLRYAKNEIEILTTVNINEKTVYVTVKDDGEGIEPTQINKIFERFQKGRKGDTGLGLAITKMIVEKHRGIITAENVENGGGALFTVKLPICL